MTVCHRKINGKWTVAHKHNSLSFGVESGRASLVVLERYDADKFIKENGVEL